MKWRIKDGDNLEEELKQMKKIGDESFAGSRENRRPKRPKTRWCERERESDRRK